jgi:hypothetical protein
MEADPPGLEIAFIALQEAKVPATSVPDFEAKFARLGWQADFRPCDRSGREASAGVALLGRDGTSFAPLNSTNMGFRIPNSSRVGFWTVAGTFVGGYVVVVVYLVSGIGLVGDNLDLLNEIAATLHALGKPYIVIGDWNASPAELRDCNWLSAIAGNILATKDPTCIMTNSSSIIDYAVVSAHWNAPDPPNRDFGRHLAVAFPILPDEPNQTINVLRQPPWLPRVRLRNECVCPFAWVHQSLFCHHAL